ncbi:MAG: hypothetical protein KGI51_02615 [Rhodospirillales bacterium]|nr:hypothetical protein [Rhodospirillales bacterium]
MRMLASLPLAAGADGPRLTGAGIKARKLPGPPGGAAGFPHGATFLVGGPPSGRLHGLARSVAQALTQGLPPETHIALASIGGADGVTAANRFAATVPPDGRTLLFGPGATMIAWLIGDARARFDVGSWVPVLAGESPAMLLARVPPARLAGGARVRVGIERVAGPDLAGLLAIALLGGEPVPVAFPSPGAASFALSRGEIEAMLVQGPTAANRAEQLGRAGAATRIGLGSTQPNGALGRDPSMPAQPHLAELYRHLHGRAPQGPLFDAWRALAIAAQLVFMIDLPPLTPATMVALWRGAASGGSAQLAAPLAEDGARTLAGPALFAAARGIAVGVPALLALRRWLSTRPGWPMR